MARRKKTLPVILGQFPDCLLGVMYPLPDQDGIPVAVYSADMIAARLRDCEQMTLPEARTFVTDHIEQNYLGPGTPRLIWAATEEDFGKPVATR